MLTFFEEAWNIYSKKISALTKETDFASGEYTDETNKDLGAWFAIDQAKGKDGKPIGLPDKDLSFVDTIDSSFNSKQLLDKRIRSLIITKHRWVYQPPSKVTYEKEVVYPDGKKETLTTVKDEPGYHTFIKK